MIKPQVLKFGFLSLPMNQWQLPFFNSQDLQSSAIWGQSRSLRRQRFFLKIIAFSHIQTNVDRALLVRLYLQHDLKKLRIENAESNLLCLNNLKALHWLTTFWGNEDGRCFETPQSRLSCSQSTASWSHFNVKPLGAENYTGHLRRKEHDPNLINVCMSWPSSFGLLCLLVLLVDQPWQDLCL